jgi:hypothetical protein
VHDRVRPRRRTASITSVLTLALAVAPEGMFASGGGVMQQPKKPQTAAQQKISSRLLREIDRVGHGGEKTQRDPTSGVAIDTKGRALVEIRCDVTDAIRTKLRALRAAIVSSLAEYRSILAWVPLTRMEELAGDNAVYSIQPAPQSTTNRRRERWQ